MPTEPKGATFTILTDAKASCLTKVMHFRKAVTDELKIPYSTLHVQP